MISSEEALKILRALVTPIKLGNKHKKLGDTLNRILALSLTSHHNQPNFDMSAMDGYALKFIDNIIGKKLKVIGEASAGQRYKGDLGEGEAVRIFTGAQIPNGAETIVIQENTSINGQYIFINSCCLRENYIRSKGKDFKKGFLLEAPIKINPRCQLLIAAMGHLNIPVKKRPKVAILSTGSELSPIEKNLAPGKVIASNSYSVAALLKTFGAKPLVFPIIPDDTTQLKATLEYAAGLSDLVITIGGASVGDYDLVKQAGFQLSMKLEFDRVAIRPGKPIFAGKILGTPIIGLPGNPVSAYLCTYYFIKPTINSLLGFSHHKTNRETVVLDSYLPENGARSHLMRAKLSTSQGTLKIRPVSSQDSSLIQVLYQANALILRPQNDTSKKPGELVEILRLY